MQQDRPQQYEGLITHLSPEEQHTIQNIFIHAESAVLQLQQQAQQAQTNQNIPPPDMVPGGALNGRSG